MPRKNTVLGTSDDSSIFKLSRDLEKFDMQREL